MKTIGMLLIAVAIIAGMVGCGGTPSSVEIRNWYDLDAVRNRLNRSYILMNDLDSTTAGYAELASPTANGGKGWQPIGTFDDRFTRSFDGQGYEIRDLFVNRPDESYVGLFSSVDERGRIQGISMVNVTVTGNLSVGGLVGRNVGTVSNSYSTGSVTGDEAVGGLVGENYGTVTGSFSTSSVTGDNWVGGVVGFNIYFATVSNCYAMGNVSGVHAVGGLVGENYATDALVSNSYATGSVTGNSSVGGLVGLNLGGTVTNSFWDIETSGQSTSDGGTGKNTTEMKDINTFSGAGWNMVAVANAGTRNLSYIWNIVDGVTYPFLSWEPIS